MSERTIVESNVFDTNPKLVTEAAYVNRWVDHASDFKKITVDDEDVAIVQMIKSQIGVMAAKRFNKLHDLQSMIRAAEGNEKGTHDKAD